MLKIGDKVHHDFSREKGVIIAKNEVAEDTGGYDYLVEWTLPDGTKKEDWMRKSVLVKI